MGMIELVFTPDQAALLRHQVIQSETGTFGLNQRGEAITDATRSASSFTRSRNVVLCDNWLACMMFDVITDSHISVRRFLIPILDQIEKKLGWTRHHTKEALGKAA